MSSKLTTLRHLAAYCCCFLVISNDSLQGYTHASGDNEKENIDGKPIVSSMHCVGETFLPDESWLYRSCRFWNMCWKQSNMTSFTLFPSVEELELQKAFNDLVFLKDKMTKVHTVSISSSSLSSTPHVSLQAINNQQKGTRWFPLMSDWESFRRGEMTALPTAIQITRLPNSSVVVPIVWSSLDVSKRWKDYFAVYMLLTMFGLDYNKTEVVILELANNEVSQLPTYLKRWQSDLFASDLISIMNGSNSIICAPHAVAGIGRIAATFLDETGGGFSSNTFFSHSIFRGIGILEFRSDLLRRLGISSNIEPAKRVSKCVWTSASLQLCHGFLGAILQLDESTSLQRIASTAIETKALFVDGACPFLLPLATFLPRGSSLVVIGPTLERSFLMTWNHLQISFVGELTEYSE